MTQDFAIERALIEGVLGKSTLHLAADQVVWCLGCIDRPYIAAAMIAVGSFDAAAAVERRMLYSDSGDTEGWIFMSRGEWLWPPSDFAALYARIRDAGFRAVHGLPSGGLPDDTCDG